MEEDAVLAVLAVLAMVPLRWAFLKGHDPSNVSVRVFVFWRPSNERPDPQGPLETTSETPQKNRFFLKISTL